MLVDCVSFALHVFNAHILLDQFICTLFEEIIGTELGFSGILAYSSCYCCSRLLDISMHQILHTLTKFFFCFYSEFVWIILACLRYSYYELLQSLLNRETIC